MNLLWIGLRDALVMAWQTCWALVLGFGISAALRVFVSREQMGRLFGRANLRSIVLATGFGAASSSCSYAAAAAARSAFGQGAALIPALAFMFASTNLVFELCATLWLLMGWRFVLAEAVGAFVLIGLVWGLGRLVFPTEMEQEARLHAQQEDDAGCCHHSSQEEALGENDGSHRNRVEGRRTGPWKAMADAFFADWAMLWKEIAFGFLIAGYLMSIIPVEAWHSLFLQGGPGWLRLIENAFVGPLIAVASFVCSVGNIPLASVLWSGGISFGGVISFIYADLLIIPLILIYRKSYGGKAAAYISGVFFLAMAGAGIVVDLLFNIFGLQPGGPRPPAFVEMARFSLNYTTYLNFLSLVVVTLFWRISADRGGRSQAAYTNETD